MRSRREYEQSVRALAIVAELLLDEGEPIEAVARRAVLARNRLKEEFRSGLPEELIEFLEGRNRDFYDHPGGPTPEQQFARYGSWEAVLAAAARHGRFNRSA